VSGVFFIQMPLPKCISLVVTLALVCISNTSLAEQAAPISETYSDTLRMLKAWVDSDETEDFARLSADADTRAPDLMAACRSGGEEIAGAAFQTLQFLGKSECESCADLFSNKHKTALVCGPDLTERDFERVERWWAKRQTRNGFKCGKDYEPLTPLDDSVIYALILDGSPRSQSLLNGMHRLEKTCVAADETTILGEILEHAQAHVLVAKGIGNTLRIEPQVSEASIRAAAFWLPREYQQKSKVEVLAHNRTGDRILFQVSYYCGPLCGSGYYVVLRKDGLTWRYAVIKMAWIS
jgi:hypothetical protein